MITIIELARLAGVSDATVSMVLNGKDRGRVGAKRRQQILRLARQRGYRTNPAARALANGRTNHIGLCVAGTISSHAIIGEFSLHMRLELFAEGLQRAGYAIELIQLDPHETSQPISRQLLKRTVDGLIFLNWPRELLERPLASIAKKDIPTVASGTSLKEACFSWTDLDEPAVVSATVDQLSREGRSRIALIDNVITPPSIPNIRAFEQAVKRDARLASELPLVVSPRSADYDSVRACTETLLREHPRLDGIILTDNFLAQPVLNALREQGRVPGRDVRIIGCGDTIFADRCSPKLSHYSLCIEEQVQIGLEMLMEQIQNRSKYRPRHARLPPKYIARET